MQSASNNYSNCIQSYWSYKLILNRALNIPHASRKYNHLHGQCTFYQGLPLTKFHSKTYRTPYQPKGVYDSTQILLIDILMDTQKLSHEVQLQFHTLHGPLCTFQGACFQFTATKVKKFLEENHYTSAKFSSC